MKIMSINPVFVEYIPEQIDEGVLYISEPFNTAIHKCCCGCGEEVVTPFSPAKWRLIKGDGVVSLVPSIGNWDYECQSHYFINNNQIIWAGQMSPEQIRRVQKRDTDDNHKYIEYLNEQRKFSVFRKLFNRLLNWFKSLFK